MRSALLIGKPAETINAIAHALAADECQYERVDGGAGAIRRFRQRLFDVIITDPDTTIEEDLALLEELGEIRPGVKAIVLAPSMTPADVISALRARVFVCLSFPFDAAQIAQFTHNAAADPDWRIDIEVLSAQPEWVSLRASCRLLTAERVMTFLHELHAKVPQALREDLMVAFREILLDAMETSASRNQYKVVEISAVRTRRTLVFYVRDPFSGLGRQKAAHAGMRPVPVSRFDPGSGRYSAMLAQGIVDELIFGELGNEVLLIKHTAGAAGSV